MAAQFWESRELTWRLFVRDMTAGHRDSLLSFAWAVFPTLATAATFTGLYRANVLTVGETALPYPLYVLVGTTIWQFFAGGLEGMTGALAGAGELITKVRFPRKSLLLAAVGRTVFDLMIRLVAVAAVFALMRFAPAPQALLIPLALLPLGLLMVGLGGILALAHSVTRDVGRGLRVLLPFWMLLTPVAYPPPAHGTLAMLNRLNPVTPFVEAIQDLLARGHLTQPHQFITGCAVSLVIFLIGVRVFTIAEAFVVECV